MKDLFKDLDNRIRLGKAKEVATRLRKVNSAKIPRSLLFEGANIARRAGVPLYAVRLLNPIVRNEKDLLHPATTAEKAEYAVALTRIGVVTEASRILAELDPQEDPQVLLYRAYAAFAEWDSEAAITHLEQFVVAQEVSDYLRLVGQVNLASGLIGASHYDKATQLLAELREKTLAEGHDLLYGNCLELSSQLAMLQMDFPQAEHFIDKGLCVFGGKKNIYEFFVRKNRAFIQLLSQGVSDESLLAVKQVRQEAQTIEHWESVRDCDFYTALATRDDKLFQQVLFGTPFSSYCDKMIEMYGGQSEFGGAHIWRPDGLSQNPGRVFDVRLGTENGESFLKPGQLLHRLLSTLSSDFYHPFRMGEIFSKLFPQEHFNPFSSPDRIYQLVKRLRQWLEASEIPLQVEERDGAYVLSCEQAYGIRVYRKKMKDPGHALVFLRMKSAWGENLFSARELSAFGQFSHSKANTMISWAIEHGLLERVGSGPRVKYRLRFREEALPLAV